MIDEVTRALLDHLAAATTSVGENWIVPTSLEADGTLEQDKLHVMLYAIEQHGHLRNTPLQRTSAGDFELPPIALRLHYLMTYQPATDDHLEEQRRLSRVIQLFHTTPILGAGELPATLPAEIEQLTVRLQSPTAEERNQIWTALGRSLRLAVYFEVDVAFLPPLSHEGWGQITESELKYQELVP